MSTATASTQIVTPRCPVFERWLGRAPDFDAGLEWVPEGMGALRVTDPPYDADYFENYRRLADTPMGRAITAARVALVAEYTSGPVVDVGIGCGSFIKARGGRTWGYDVNPEGIRWLEERGLWRDPYEEPVDAVTLWDVLEHIEEPDKLLRRVGLVFMSLPIVPGGGPPSADWKHYKPREHCWYWTESGLVRWMTAHGFWLCRASAVETRLGRQDIGTYVFQRGTPP